MLCLNFVRCWGGLSLNALVIVAEANSIGSINYVLWCANFLIKLQCKWLQTKHKQYLMVCELSALWWEPKWNRITKLQNEKYKLTNLVPLSDGACIWYVDMITFDITSFQIFIWNASFIHIPSKLSPIKPCLFLLPPKNNNRWLDIDHHSHYHHPISINVKDYGYLTLGKGSCIEANTFMGHYV